MIKFSNRTKLIAGALALALAGVSHASGTQVGGGATMPSIGYAGSNAQSELQLYGTTGSNAIASGSLFGQVMSQDSITVSYCLTGSGAGKDILAGGTIPAGGTEYSVQNSCTKNSAGTVTGFGAPTVSRTDLTQPDFAAADSPINATDYSNYQSNRGTGAYPTQFPAVAGAIAIAFNLWDNTGAQVTSSEVNLSDAQICSILDGTVTNWDATSLATAFTLPSGHSIPSTAINVQYRSDGSGTTFSLANHLANVCGEINSTYFQTNQTFTTVVAGFEPTLPSNWTGHSGNAAVAASIGTTETTGNGNVGYVEYANANDLGLQFAKVNGVSPASFGAALTITSAALEPNEVISSTNNTNGTAALQAISSPPATKCIYLVIPADYAVPGSKGSILASTSYPIVGVSYLLGNANGNESTDQAAIVDIVNSPYSSAITSKVTTIGSGTGLAFLTLGSGAFSATAPGACITTNAN
jgi:phosphate transport system substrate-binding protein